VLSQSEITQEEISYIPSIEKDIDDLKENKVESTDIFSEHNVSQVKDRKYQNYYLDLTSRKIENWRSFTSEG
jgi:hypothetical protein